MANNKTFVQIARDASWRETAFVALTFTLLSSVLVGVITHCDPLRNTTFGPDPAFYLWSLKWWPHSLTSLHNPFHPPIFYPSGLNLAWTTSAPALALLAAPFTLILGPVFALNAINTLALAANGVLAYLISKELDCKRTHALVCALLFYFSSYTWGQLLGHLSITATGFAIAFVYVTVLRAHLKIGRLKYAIVAALLLALQFWTSVEVYATLLFFSAMAFVIFVLSLGWRSVAKKAIQIGLDIGISICGSLILMSPYLYEMSVNFVSNFQNISNYVADPANYVLPTQTNWILGHVFSAISSKFVGNTSEQNVYLGVPMLVLLVMAGRSFYSKPINRALLISLLAIVLCSFGPRLTLLGTPTIWLPWFWIEKLPLIREALPSRFGLYTSLLAAILVGRILTGVPKWDIKVLAVASLCLLLPNLRLYWPGTVPQSSFISSGMYKGVIPRGAAVLVLPTYEFGGYEAPLWQAQANFWFALANGPVSAYQSTRSKYGSVFEAGRNPSGYGSDLLRFIKDTNTRFVLADNQTSDAQTSAFEALGFPFRQYGSTRLYDLSDAALDEKIKNIHAHFTSIICNSLFELAKIGRGYVSKGGTTASLIPFEVADGDFVSKYGTPMPAGSKEANWTSSGYWLGGWGGPLAVGISPVDGMTAARLYASFHDEAEKIYFPYPSIFHGEPRSGESGMVLVVLKDGGPVVASCNQ